MGALATPRAAFTTLGCKVNQYETQKIMESFASAGFEIVPFDAEAELYVVNSCSVTSQAEAKSGYTVRRARRNNPEGRVVVTGCAAQMSVNKEEVFEGADVLVPNPEKLETIHHVLRALPSLAAWVESEPAARDEPKPRGRTRATLKIQDGCNVMCSYCSIPFTRPGMVSRPWTDVLAEAKHLADSGYQEAVLTGVLIGAYGQASGSGGPGFEDLVARLAEDSGIARLRISSIEMHQVTQPIIDLAKSGKIVPHFHVPLQSGDDQVLKDMNRRYDSALFVDLCHRLKAEVPGVTITTDIMVGFPTETEERFESSVRVCEQVGFLKAHVFRFSPRFGTPADAWGDPVDPQAKQDRAKRLTAVTELTGLDVVASTIGTVQRVLVEHRGKDGLLEGNADNWVTVKLAGPDSLLKQLCHARITETSGGVAYGELCEPVASSAMTLKQVCPAT